MVKLFGQLLDHLLVVGQFGLVVPKRGFAEVHGDEGASGKSGLSEWIFQNVYFYVDVVSLPVGGDFFDVFDGGEHEVEDASVRVVQQWDVDFFRGYAVVVLKV